MALDLLKVGDSVPEFSLLDFNEELFTLKDLKGKGIVLWFFPKANTPG